MEGEAQMMFQKGTNTYLAQHEGQEYVSKDGVDWYSVDKDDQVQFMFDRVLQSQLRAGLERYLVQAAFDEDCNNEDY